MALIDQSVNVSTNENIHFVLLTVKDPAQDVRLVNNVEKVRSRGNDYLAYPFDITLPEQSSEKNSELTLTIDNADQLLIDAIRSQIEPPEVVVELVLSNDLDNVVISYDFLQLVNVEYNAMNITGILMSNDMLHRKFPSCSYDGVQFPDLMY